MIQADGDSDRISVEGEDKILMSVIKYLFIMLSYPLINNSMCL